MRATLNYLFLLIILQGMSACGKDESGSSPGLTPQGKQQDAGRQLAELALTADQDLDTWALHGRTYDEQRFSPLDQIHKSNVDQLGVAWALDIPSPNGLVSTPIIVDGIIYLSAPFSVIHAIDAASGELLWTYDPKVKLNLSVTASWVSRWNRGVAVADGKVIVGTGDCRLVAIDAKDGSPAWDVKACDSSAGYGITGAPRLGNGMVFIGNAAADFGLRGYVSAFDVETGEQLWRFYTVPRDPALGQESEILEMAVKTWSGDIWHQFGGGASVWDSMTYDEELNRLYVGTDSALPWDTGYRNEEELDNLFTNSIIALDADSGEYIWHYQTVPADKWDYNAAAHMILADLELEGQTRKVLMQAPKNGFFYVLDRKNGKLLSANNFTTVTWASHIDLETGRPVVNPEARYTHNESGETFAYPYIWGGHNWHPMSYNPETGLVYIPAMDVKGVFRKLPAIDKGFSLQTNPYGTGNGKVTKNDILGKLVAWDPVTQSARWSQDHRLPWNGGVLSTEGGLVFQGNAEGMFNAYAADDGELLWSIKTGSAIQAPPVTVRINGEQLVIIPIGWGGPQRLWIPSQNATDDAKGGSRLIAFKLGGEAEYAVEKVDMPAVPEPPQQTANAETIAKGEFLFLDIGCSWCHGVGAVGGNGSVPDLRYLTKEKHQAWEAIVLGGAYQHKGMLSFKDALSQEDAKAIQAYVIDRAWAAYNKNAE